MLRRHVGTGQDGEADRLGTAPARYRYDTHDPEIYGNRMGRYKTDRQLSFIRAALPTRSARVLDVGGGAGRLAIPLAQMGHELTVIDPSTEALELLDGRTGSAVKTAHSDLMSFEPGLTYDAVLIVDTVKYMRGTSLVDAFAKAGELLSPGGLLVIADINRASWRNRVSERVGRRRGGPPYNIASAAGYREALVAAGLAVGRSRGLVWMPLPFNSDSRLVGLFAHLESLLHLEAWVSQSPWLLIAAQKVGDAPASGTSPHQRTTVGESAFSA